MFCNKTKTILLVILFSDFASQQKTDFTNISVVKNEVFYFQLNSNIFLNSTTEQTPRFRFSASLLNSPDLPAWLHYRYNKIKNTGLLYGLPPSDITAVQLEIIAININYFDTHRIEVDIVMKDDGNNVFRNSVQMKINNMNIDDLFDDTNQLQNIKSVFQHVIWPGSGNLRLTNLEPANDDSGRPLHPSDYDGVVLQLSSSAPFSSQMMELQRHAERLYGRRPCPSNYERSTYERHFRQRGLVLDWCHFRLVVNDVTTQPPTTTPVPTPSDGISFLWTNDTYQLLPYRNRIPVRSYISDSLTAVCVPLLIGSILAGLLTCMMCWRGERMSSQTTVKAADIQMVHYDPQAKQHDDSYSYRDSMRSYKDSTLQRLMMRDVSPRLSEYSPAPSEPLLGATSSRMPDPKYRPTPPPYGSLQRHSDQDTFWESS